MARYTGPKCRMCRREGVSLCSKHNAEKCGVVRRPQAPGQHGTSRRRPSGYATQLREKQRAKRIYGLVEKQFRNYVLKAMAQKEVTGEALMQILELRLDNVLYRAGFASSRPQARQFARFGYFAVNGRTVTIPSFALKVGDEITVNKDEKIAVREIFKLPEWLDVEAKSKKIKITSMPTIDQIQTVENEVNPQLIVEYYSR